MRRHTCPWIWATQVLEGLAKTGAPRAEVTDAAMSARAECVMLNKGPYIGEATHFLSSASAHGEHQSKRARPCANCRFADDSLTHAFPDAGDVQLR